MVQMISQILLICLPIMLIYSSDAMMQECEEIKRQLPISSYVRPAWDLETLGKLGINRFSIDLGISSRIYTKKDEFYNPTPMFLICGEKNKCNN